MSAKLMKALASYRLEPATDATVREIVTSEELLALPHSARRFMSFHGITPGSPKHTSLVLTWTGDFRLAPDRPWMPIEAVQRNTRSPITRIFLMQARMKDAPSRSSLGSFRSRAIAAACSIATSS
jgi:hypothetical protein